MAVLKLDMEKAKTRKDTKIITIKPKEKKTKIHIRKVKEVNKHIDNIRLLLLNTNCTPIRCHAGIGYQCCFCRSQFPEAADLKKHTIEDHDDTVKANFMEGISIQSFLVKLDITCMRCKLCSATFQELDDLISHLIDHGLKYNTDIKSQIIPFRFDTDKLKCIYCNKPFNNFKVIIEHMNVHFNNHVCEVCGRGFVNRRTLQSHSYRHLTGGEFKCTYCPKIYDTRVKKRDHERAVHICQNKRNRCSYCGVKFTDYAKKKEHEVKEHGAKPVVLKCQACTKTFENQRLLTIHTKAFHLMERRPRKSKEIAI